MSRIILFSLLIPFYSMSQVPVKIESSLKTVDILSHEIKTVYTAGIHFEAPNWSNDGSFFVVNSIGRLYTIPIDGSVMNPLNTDFADECNNDHGISPDGKWLAISHNNKNDTIQTEQWKKSAIYILPIQGGIPRQVTPESPSFWHGWSPDGKELAYCAERNGNFDIYTIPVSGGREKQLTHEPGLDDGPDYSPDGKYIYFNSFRTGSMQIWRMKTDGSQQEQITNDFYSNWFAHPSPDGKWIVFISYLVDQAEAHPFGKDVKLRLMSVADRKISDLTPVFFGGQGTLNVPSWSPDSKQVAFVSYLQNE
ncbi:MAG: transporter [Bacteroidales bacterium]|nr:transporter [Bacteroidales bacterium]